MIRLQIMGWVLSMRYVFISIPHGSHARDLLRLELLDILTEDRKITVVILTPAYQEKKFLADFSRDNVIVKELVRPNLSWFQRKFIGLLNKLLVDWNFDCTYKIQIFNKNRSSAFIYMISFLQRILKRYKILIKILLRIERKLIPDRYYKDLFAKYHPSLVITCTITKLEDSFLLKRANLLGVPTFTIVQSWDNLTSKGPTIVEPNRLSVWNDIMKKEAIDLHGFSPDKVDVLGVPQFDIYFNGNIRNTRDEFFKSMHLDKRKVLLTLTTAPLHIFNLHDDIIEIILKAVSDEKFVKDVQLIVRLHPNDDTSIYTKFEMNPLVTLDYPKNRSNTIGWNPDENDMYHLADTLKYSDVIINVASSITIEACVFDTPVVNIGFDGYEDRPPKNSTTRFYNYTHYQHIMNRRGVKVAWNADELVDHINLYLKDPSKDFEGRLNIVKDQVKFMDGKSTERIAHRIIDLITDESSSIHQQVKIGAN